MIRSEGVGVPTGEEEYCRTNRAEVVAGAENSSLIEMDKRLTRP
jgi:hypothetical protein